MFDQQIGRHSAVVRAISGLQCGSIQTAQSAEIGLIFFEMGLTNDEYS